MYSDEKHVSPLQNITKLILRKIPQTEQVQTKTSKTTQRDTKINLSDLLSNCSILFARIVYFSECMLNLVRVITPVSLRVTCAWVSEFRLFLPHICLPETKKKFI